MKYIRRMIAAAIVFALLVTNAYADRLSQAYEHLFQVSLELSSITVDAVLDRIGLIAETEEAVLKQIEDGKILIDKTGLATELLSSKTLGDFFEVLCKYYGEEIGSVILESLIESGYLTVAKGIWGLADWAVAAYDGLDAVSVNSSNIILAEAEEVNDNLNEIYAFIETRAMKDIAEYGFVEPEERKAQLDSITNRFHEDAERIYKKIKEELKKNQFNLFRNPKEHVELERLRNAFKAYLEEEISYYDYYAGYVKEQKRNPKSIDFTAKSGGYEEESSMIYADVEAESAFAWLSYTYEIMNNGRLVYSEKKINDGRFEYKCDYPGEYVIQVTIEDRWGQKKTTCINDVIISEKEPAETNNNGEVIPSPSISLSLEYIENTDPMRVDMAVIEQEEVGPKEYAFDEIEMLAGNVSAYRIGDLWGIILKDGTLASNAIYSDVGLCMCDQGKRLYGFDETVFAVKNEGWVIISPDTGLEAGVHSVHGGVTGIPLWNNETQTYTNPSGSQWYEGGVSIAFDTESTEKKQTYTLIGDNGNPIITGTEFITIPTRGRSILYSYTEDMSVYCLAVKDGCCKAIKADGSEWFDIGIDAKEFFDGIAPVLTVEGWKYFDSKAQCLTEQGYELATTVTCTDGAYYAWVKEDGAWKTIAIHPAPVKEEKNQYVDSYDYSKAEWPNENYQITNDGDMLVDHPELKGEFRFYYTWDQQRGGYQIIRVENLGISMDNYWDSYILEFPDRIEGDDVVSIAENCCKNMKGFFEVDWPDHLQYVGDFAFYNCTDLYGASLPATVQYIGDWCFTHCDLWSGVSFSETAAIGVGAFADTPDAVFSGIIVLKESENAEEIVASTYGEHCPHAIYDEGSPEAEAYIRSREGRDVLPKDRRDCDSRSENTDGSHAQRGEFGYRDGIVEVIVTIENAAIHVEIAQDSLDEMLQDVRVNALDAVEQINADGHANGIPEQDNAQICSAVYHAVRQALKRMNQ